MTWACAWPQKPAVSPWREREGGVILPLWCHQMLSGLKNQMSAACSVFVSGRLDGAVWLVGADPVRGCSMAERLAWPPPCCSQRCLHWGSALCLPHCLSGLFPFHCTAQCLLIPSSIRPSFFIKCHLFTGDVLCRCWFSNSEKNIFAWKDTISIKS